MKKLLKYLVAAFLLISLGAPAQSPGDSRPLADNSTFKGRRELKREKKIKSSERKNAKQQERKSLKKRDYGTKIVIGKRKQKKSKNKERKGKNDNDNDNG